MRIAEIAPPWVAVPPAGYGGTEVVVDSLCRGFHAAGHEVLLVTVPESECPVPKYAASPEIDPTRMNWTEIELRHVIRAYERVKDFDIVHDHTMLGPIYSERFPKLRVVTTQHHPNGSNFNESYRASAHRVPMVAISHKQARLSKEFGIGRVIHHGIDASRFEFNNEPDDYVVFLGRIAPSKGVHHAVHAARAAGIRLKIAGRVSDNEGEREYFDAEIKPYLDENIEFAGEVGGQVKIDLLKNAKAMLNPICWDEPFGLVMTEAMACGTPVLAFPRGSVPEIVDHGKTGFICQDAEEMALFIDKLDQINRRDCRAAIEGHFSSRRMVNDYLDFFQELLDIDAATQPASQFLDLNFHHKRHTILGDKAEMVNPLTVLPPEELTN